jgi:hypothetical protein
VYGRDEKRDRPLRRESVQQLTDITLLADRMLEVAYTGIRESPRGAFMGLLAIGTPDDEEGIFPFESLRKRFDRGEAIEKEIPISYIRTSFAERAQVSIPIPKRVLTDMAAYTPIGIMLPHVGKAFPL